VKLEMERLQKGPFGRYRISRLVDFKQTLNHLNYNTDQQIQDLVAYGLQDLNGQTLASKAKEVLKNIGDSASQLDDDDDEDNDGILDAVEKSENYKSEASRAGDL
jgi:hypothetical protein